MSKIKFTATFFKVSSHTIVLLPKEESKKLPSRGMCMVEGTINGEPVQMPLEPDGRGSHFFLLNGTKIKRGDSAKVEVEALKDWPEPHIPEDLKKALAEDKKAKDIWNSATPIAHWDWLRWIQGTKNADTRKKRIRVAMSKMEKGEKRPCCFNRSMCTIEEVSKSGKLLDPTPTQE